MGKTSLEKLMVAQLCKKFSAFYGTQWSYTAFTNPPTGPYPEPDESILHLSTAILFSHRLQSVSSFHIMFSNKIFYAYFISVPRAQKTKYCHVY
jgi:hypothetical protein